MSSKLKAGAPDAKLQIRCCLRGFFFVVLTPFIRFGHFAFT